MRGLLEGTLGLLWLVVVVAFNVTLFGTVNGAVKEHCLDVGASEALQRVDVDSHWTYVLWPPLPFAAVDPAGRCVRNNPAREALDYVGIWELPSPEEQVRRHVVGQLREER